MTDIWAAERTKRPREFGALKKVTDFRGAETIGMELVAPQGASWSALAHLWLQQPRHPNIIDPIKVEGGNLIVEYAAINWSFDPAHDGSQGSSRRIMAWAVELTRIFDFLATCFRWIELGEFCEPRILFDIEDQLRLVFFPAAPSGELVPPEVASGWPRCRELGLVYLVAELVVLLAGEGFESLPIAPALMQALSRDPKRRYASLRDMREDLIKAGAPREGHERDTHPDVWREVEAGIGWLSFNQPSYALSTFEHALALGPKHPLALQGHEAALAAGGTRAPKPEPNPNPKLEWDATFAKAQAHETERAFTSALSLYYALAPHPTDDSRRLVAIARCHSNVLDQGYAIDHANRALAIDAKNLEAHAIKADSLFHHRDPKGSLAAADELVALTPDDGRPYYLRGRAQFALGRLLEAREAFDRASKLDPKLLEAMLLRREVDRALGNLKSTVGADVPQPELPKHLRAVRDAVTSGRLDEAIDLLQAPAYERDAVAQLFLAGCLVFARRYESAIAAYDRALELGTDQHAAAIAGKALAQLELGKPEAALATLDRTPAIDQIDLLDARAKVYDKLGRKSEASALRQRADALTTKQSTLRVRSARGF